MTLARRISDRYNNKILFFFSFLFRLAGVSRGSRAVGFYVQLLRTGKAYPKRVQQIYA